MIKAVNTIRIEKGRSDEVLPLFQKPKDVHKFEGFVVMEVLRNETSEEYDELDICTTWEERKHFDQWLEARNHRKEQQGQQAGKRSEDSPILGAELNIYEVAYRHEPARKQEKEA